MLHNNSRQEGRRMIYRWNAPPASNSESTQAASPALTKLNLPHHGPAGGAGDQNVPMQKNTKAKTSRIVPIMGHLRKTQMHNSTGAAI